MTISLTWDKNVFVKMLTFSIGEKKKQFSWHKNKSNFKNNIYQWNYKEYYSGNQNPLIRALVGFHV